MQKAINKEFLIKKEKFDLEQCIIEILEYYNYQKIYSTTEYTPFDLKDTQDIDIINTFIENIQKTMQKFSKQNKRVYHSEDKYLLIENCKISRKTNTLLKIKKIIIQILS